MGNILEKRVYQIRTTSNSNAEFHQTNDLQNWLNGFLAQIAREHKDFERNYNGPTVTVIVEVLL